MESIALRAAGSSVAERARRIAMRLIPFLFLLCIINFLLK